MTTTTIVFGSDFVTTFANINPFQARDTCDIEMVTPVGVNIYGGQLPDTCAIVAFADLAVNLPIQQAVDTCAITLNTGVQVNIDCQQQADTGSIYVLNIPIPVTTLDPPGTSPFQAREPAYRYVATEKHSPAVATEE